MTLLPGALALLLVFAGAMPLRAVLMADLLPPFSLMAIYYWGLFRESLMPFWFVFLLGLLQDALLWSPLGASSLTFLLFRMLVLGQKRLLTRDTFWSLWMGYAVLSLFACLVFWMAVSYAATQWLPAESGLMQWVVGAACYPFMHLLFTRIYKHIPKERPVNV